MLSNIILYLFKGEKLMISLGILRSYKLPGMSDRLIAMTAKEINGDAIFFNIEGVDFDKKIIKGRRLRNGVWVESASLFPDIFFNDLPQSNALYQKYLQLERVSNRRLLIHHRTIDKAGCNSLFKNYPDIMPHLVPTFSVDKVSQIIALLEQYRRIVLKPNSSHKGYGIKFIRQYDDTKYELLHETGKTELLTVTELSAALEKLLPEKRYHIQPEIISHLKGTNFPFVIRSYMGRGINGQWHNLFNYAAMDYQTGGVVNVSIGSALQFFPNFLERQFEPEAREVFIKKLRELSFKIVKAYQENLDEEIDAVGIDYVIDPDGKPYMVEINYYPGTRPHNDLCTYNQVRFAEYLCKEGLNIVNRAI